MRSTNLVYRPIVRVFVRTYTTKRTRLVKPVSQLDSMHEAFDHIRANQVLDF